MDIPSVDEAPEFQPAVIEALPTPLESGMITLGRSEVHARFPARFQLILAANPCPCGQAATPGGQCQCTPTVVRRYAEKISGPIRDRNCTSGNGSSWRVSSMADVFPGVPQADDFEPGHPEGGGDNQSNTKQSAASLMVELAHERYNFGVTEEGQPYAVKPALRN